VTLACRLSFHFDPARWILTTHPAVNNSVAKQQCGHTYHYIGTALDHMYSGWVKISTRATGKFLTRSPRDHTWLLCSFCHLAISNVLWLPSAALLIRTFDGLREARYLVWHSEFCKEVIICVGLFAKTTYNRALNQSLKHSVGRIGWPSGARATIHLHSLNC
jgi:hypothetical protein